MALHSIELCAGVGMLGEGLRAALRHFGRDVRPVAYVEREAPAAAQLVRLMEAGALDPCPVWSDLLTFDGAAWRGCVDLVVAGFPCQDLSIAGRRAGLDGARSGLFFNVLDIADACGAWGLVLENVSGIASATAAVVDEAEGELEERAAARVLGELADRGWDAEWITLSASDVGASHGRARWFCLAWRRVVDTERPERWPQRIAGAGGKQGAGSRRREANGGPGISVAVLDDPQRIEQPGQRVHPGSGPGGAGAADADGAGIAVADADGNGQRTSGQRSAAERHPEQGSKSMADTGEPRLAQRVGQRGVRGEPLEPIARPDLELHVGALGIFAPGPADPRWPGIIREHPGLAPATESGVRMLADGMALVVHESRAHQLRQVGNGVVAACAGVAFAELLRRAGLT